LKRSRGVSVDRSEERKKEGLCGKRGPEITDLRDISTRGEENK